MGSPLIEDFSDAVAFVQEDTSYFEQNASDDDEVDRKIEEEHAKYKEARSKRQEEVRASRPWSAPPVESPRPEQQKEREKERQARGSIGDVDLDAPREEYEPPARPYLLQAQASGQNLSYLSRPQSAELRTVANSRIVNQSRVSLSGIEEETGEGTVCDSRQPSEMGRLGSTFGEGEGAPKAPRGADDAVLDRDQSGAAQEEGETAAAAAAAEGAAEEDEAGEPQGASGAEDGDGGQADGPKEEEEEEEDYEPQEARPQPSAEEVTEDEAGGGGDDGEVEEEEGDEDDDGRGAAAEASGGDGGAEQVDEGVLMASADRSGAAADGPGDPFRRQSGQSDVRRSSPGSGGGGAAGPELRGESAEGWGEEEEREDGGGGGGGGQDARSAAGSTHSMAMRGFVEPLPYDASYHAGRGSPGPVQAETSRRSAGQELSPQAEGNEDEEEQDDYGEDTFEDDEEQEEEEEEEEEERQQQQQQREGDPAPQPLASVSGEGSGLLRASPSASRALRASSSLRSRASGTAALPPPSRESSRGTPGADATAQRPPSGAPPVGSSVAGAAEDDDRQEGGEYAAATAAATGGAEEEFGGAALPPATLPPIFKSTASGAGSGVAGASTDAASVRSAAPPLAPSHSQRSVSSSGTGSIPLPSALMPPPQPPPLSELQPSQQFALQLLKHDIEVLPQHHRAAAEAAAAARRKLAATRPAGAGLAAFGYLGYHVVTDDLTATAAGPPFRGTSPGRGGSPGRSGSPGRGEGPSVGLTNSSSLKAVRSGGPMDAAAAAAAARHGGRPISAPHMRPISATLETAASGSGGGAAAAAAIGDAVSGGAGAGADFVGLAREMRAGRLLPPVVPPRGPLRSNSGSGAVGGETSVSVMEDGDLNAAVAQNRIKFDVWLDALNGTAAAGRQQGPPTGPPPPPPLPPPAAKAAGNGAAGLADAAGAGGVAGRRPPRPMTAPASGRRRPGSARPGFMNPPAVVNVPKPLMRPMSAQPHHLRPASATRGAAAGGAAGAGGGGPAASGHFDTTFDAPVTVNVQPPDAPAAAGGTAAVEVGGVTVSVYVADTLKRIVEANRWLQQLGVMTKRYRLKDRFSNLTIQLVEELPPLPSDCTAGALGDIGGAVAIVKELTLKQFLSGHAKLKQQAKKVRNAATAAAQQQQSQQLSQPGMSFGGAGGGGSGMYGGALDHGFGSGGGGAAGRGNRPFSAGFGGGAGGASGFGVAPAANGSRARPASAMTYSGARAAGNSGGGGGADPSMYGTLGAPGGSGGAYPSTRPARPSSANPAYGRAPAFTSYNSGSSPPGVGGSPFLHTAYAAQAAAGGGVVVIGGGGGKPLSGPGPSAPRAAWGSAGGSSGGAYLPYESYTVAGGRGSSGGGAAASNGGLPYMHRSISATRGPGPDGHGPNRLHTHVDDDNDSERPLYIEPDERGDVSYAVQQKLGSAADYCQSRRQEIARLRNLPYA